MNEFIYFKSVPGKLVTRFGSSTYIGAEVQRSEPKQGRFPQSETTIVWSDEPVAIPKAEYDRYRREYARCVGEGSLVKVPAPKVSKE